MHFPPLRHCHRMATAVLGVCLVLLFLCTLPACALSESDIDSEAAILMDADTGAVLYAKNIDRHMEPASITKIMTAMLALEYCSPYEQCSVSPEAVRLPAGSSHIALSPGEHLTVEQALYALMLPSANDAANVLAEYVSGSQSDFVALMNRRAIGLGANNTRFANAHGLPDPEHYTTAYDMALITRAATQSAAFMDYFGAVSFTLLATNLSPERPMTNFQHMLNPTSPHYDARVIGGKVGYTQQAGHTMSTLAEMDGRRLICVVMNTGSQQKFTDTRTLLDYGFNKSPDPLTIGSVRPVGGPSLLDPDWAPAPPDTLHTPPAKAPTTVSAWEAMTLVLLRGDRLYRYALVALLLLMLCAVLVLIYAVCALLRGIRQEKTTREWGYTPRQQHSRRKVT